MRIRKIDIEVIPSRSMRYPSSGDYFLCGDTLHIRVADMGNMFYEMLVVVHELIEWLLVTKKGIRLEEIDRFDIQFEIDRANGLHKVTDEPGDSSLAPYRKEHQFATFVEKSMAKLMKLNWKKYDSAVLKASDGPEDKGWAGGI